MNFKDASLALRAETVLLRLFAVAPLLFLAVSLTIDFALRGHFLESISAYYGSPVRDVFVGSLITVGVVYVIYRGSTTMEDRALDLAGFFVVIVALVPYNYEELVLAVNQPVVARATLFLILIAWIVISVLFYTIGLRWRNRLAAQFPERSLRVAVISCLLWVGFVAFAVVWMVSGQPYDTIHSVAAVLVVVCLIFVVTLHALGYNDEWVELRRPRWVQAVYALIAGWMFMGIVLGVLLYVFGNRSWVLITEIIEVGAFVAFWLVNLVVARNALLKELNSHPSQSEAP